MTSKTVTPFKVNISDARLEEVRRKVENVWWPREPKGVEPWYYGPEVAMMKELVSYFLDQYDWRTHEKVINTFPQFMVDVGDGQQIHTIHVKNGNVPILLMHGWPNSFHTLIDMVGPLSDPDAHGRPNGKAFDVVVPSLPGYAFSPCDRLLSPRDVAHMMNRMMKELGYDQYYVAGGDWGAHVGSLMALEYPDLVLGLHIDHSEVRHEGAAIGAGETGASDATPAEIEFIERESALWVREGAYCHQQLSRPQSLAFAMTDSPVGAMAWLAEKWYSWADVTPETFQKVFSLDRLLTEIMVYILPDSFVTATWLYAGCGDAVLTELAPGERITVPVAVSAFPDPAFPVPPREFFERTHNVVRYTKMSHGGHYPGIENTSDYADDIRTFVTTLQMEPVA